MTMGGVATATGVLLVVLLCAGAVGWNLVEEPVPGEVRLPGWLRRAGLPKEREWLCGFALMVSLVWLSLEVLRLLAELRD
jgi:uncharacterized YccA/Bax inhibitor family protein